jgi:hypothetical protein
MTAVVVYAAVTLTIAMVLAALAVVVNKRAAESPKGLDLDDPVQRRRWEQL